MTGNSDSNNPTYDYDNNPTFSSDYTALAIQGDWRKSSLSRGDHSVSVGRLSTGMIAVANTRSENGPALLFSQEDWDAFCGGIRKDDFAEFETK